MIEGKCELTVSETPLTSAPWKMLDVKVLVIFEARSDRFMCSTK